MPAWIRLPAWVVVIVAVLLAAPGIKEQLLSTSRLARVIPNSAFSLVHEREPAERLTIVLAQGMNWDDLETLQHLLPYATTGDLALITPTTGGWPIAQHAYLTIGTGAPSVLPEMPIPPLDREERWQGQPAEQLFRRLSGNEPRDAAILVPLIHTVHTANEARSPVVKPGLLADVLEEAGLSTAVFGHADTLVPGRWATVLAMDSQGRIPFGSLEGVMSRDEEGVLWGPVLDWNSVLTRWRELPTEAALVIIESGDFLQLEQLANLIAAPQLVAMRRYAVQRLANGLQQFLQEAQRLPGRQPVWLVVPAPPRQGSGAPRGFGFVQVWWDHPAGGNWLSSASTRRAGIIALTDLLPTILQEFGVSPGPMPVGRPFFPAVPAETGPGFPEWYDLATLATNLAANDQSRLWLIKAYVFIIIGVLCGALVAVVWRPMVVVVHWILPAVAVCPAVFLLLPWLGAYDATSRSAWSLVLATAASVLANRPAKRARPLLTMAVITVALVWLDVGLGGEAAVRSPLGHSLLAGARYYGIGNEYAGILIGATALAAGLCWEESNTLRGTWRNRYWINLLISLPLIILAMGLMAAQFGANFGGGMAAAIAAAVFYASTVSKQANPRAFWRPVVVVAALVLSLAVWDVIIPGEPTHVGRIFQFAIASDWSILVEVAQRKLLLNLKLIRYTIWSRVLIVSLVAIAFFVFRPAQGFTRLWRQHRGLAAAAAAGTTGALAALLLNDSGVVAAATTMIFPSVGLLSALLAESDNGR